MNQGIWEDYISSGMAADTSKGLASDVEESTQQSKLDRLNKAKQDKLDRLNYSTTDYTGTQMKHGRQVQTTGVHDFTNQQERLGELARESQIYDGGQIAQEDIARSARPQDVLDPTKKYKANYQYDAEGNIAGYTFDPYEDETRHAYMRNLGIDPETGEQLQKFGLARGDIAEWAKEEGITPEQARYMDKERSIWDRVLGKESVYKGSGGEYNGTPGGIAQAKGPALMDMEFEKDPITEFELNRYMDRATIAARAMGLGKDTRYDEFGGGGSEYTLESKDPLFRADVGAYEGELPEGTQTPTVPYGYNEKGEKLSDLEILDRKLKYLESDEETTGVGNAVKAFAYMLGEGVANTVDLVPEIAEYAYSNIVGEGKDWKDTKGLYDDKDSKAYKEWLGYNDAVINELGADATAAIKNAWENGDYWGVVKVLGDGITTPELIASSLGYVAGMILPGTAAQRAIRLVNGVNKAAKTAMAADKIGKLTKVQAIAQAEEKAGAGYKIAKQMAGQVGYVAEAEQFGRDAEDLYMETYGEEMPMWQKLLVRPVGMVYAKMDAMTAKAILLGKDPIAKAVPEMVKKLPQAMKVNMAGKVALMAGVPATKVLGAFALEGSTELVQTAMEKIAGKYKAGEVGVTDILEEDKYELGGAGLLGAAGGAQTAAPAAAATTLGGVKQAVDIAADKAYEKAKQKKVDTANEVLKEGYNPMDEVAEPTIGEFKAPDAIEKDTESIDTYGVDLEKQKQDVVNSVYAIDPKTGKAIGLNDEAKNVLETEGVDALNKKVDSVDTWMDAYAGKFGEDGTVAHSETKAIKEARAFVNAEALAMEEAKVVTEEVTRLEEVGIQEYAEELEAQGKEPEVVRDEVKRTIIASMTDMSGDKPKFKEGYTRELAEKISDTVVDRLNISGFAMPEGVKIEADLKGMKEQLVEEARVKGKVGTTKEGKKTPTVDFTKVTNDVITKLVSTGKLDSVIVDEIGLDTENSKLRQRVVDKLDPMKTSVKGNLSNTWKDLSKKLEKVVADVDQKEASKLFKNAETAGANVARLAILAMKVIDANTLSETMLRQNVDTKVSGLNADEYYASMTNVEEQIGKEYFNSYGLKLKGSPADLKRAHKQYGKFIVDTLVDNEILEKTDKPMMSVASADIVTEKGEKVGPDIGATKFKKAEGINRLTGEKVMLVPDIGVRLKGTGKTVDESTIVGEGETAKRMEYYHEYGDTAKRLAKLLVPNEEYKTITSPATGEVKVPQETAESAGRVLSKDEDKVIKELRKEAMSIPDNKLKMLEGIKQYIDENYDGSIYKATGPSGSKWLRSLLNLDETGARMLELNEKGTNNKKIDDIAAILDNLDILQGDIYHEYQGDINGRITIMNTMLNFQHDKVFSRQLLTVKGKEYTTSNKKAVDYLTHNIMEELGLVPKGATKQEIEAIKDAISEGRDTGNEKINSLLEVANQVITEDGINYEILGAYVAPRGHKYGKEFQGQSFKFLGLLEGLQDVYGSKGRVTTSYMPDMDASASGVFNTLINILGRNVDTLKGVLKQLNVEFKGEGKIGLVDAYRMLSNRVDEVLKKIKTEENEEVGKLVKDLERLGVDTRELAKPPVMTWFYSAGAKSITRELTNSLIQNVISKAAHGDKAAIKHIGEVLGREVSRDDILNMEPNGKDHKKLYNTYKQLGDVYNAELSAAFPEVESYKKEMAEHYTTLADNATVGGKDYYKGITRSAYPALMGQTEVGNSGYTSLMKQKNVLMEDQVLADDEISGEMSTAPKMMYNTASVGPGHMHNVDVAQLFAGVDEMMTFDETLPTGIMTIHDDMRAHPERLMAAQDAFNKSAIKLAINYDTVENMMLSYDKVINDMQEDYNKTDEELGVKNPEEYRRTLTEKMKLLETYRDKTRSKNDPIMEAKEGALEGAKVNLVGVQDVDKAPEGEVADDKTETEEAKDEKEESEPEIEKSIEERATEILKTGVIFDTETQLVDFNDKQTPRKIYQIGYRLPGGEAEGVYIKDVVNKMNEKDYYVGTTRAEAEKKGLKSLEEAKKDYKEAELSGKVISIKDFADIVLGSIGSGSGSLVGFNNKNADNGWLYKELERAGYGRLSEIKSLNTDDIYELSNSYIKDKYSEDGVGYSGSQEVFAKMLGTSVATLHDAKGDVETLTKILDSIARGELDTIPADIILNRRDARKVALYAFVQSDKTSEDLQSMLNSILSKTDGDTTAIDEVQRKLDTVRFGTKQEIVAKIKQELKRDVYSKEEKKRLRELADNGVALAVGDTVYLRDLAETDTTSVDSVLDVVMHEVVHTEVDGYLDTDKGKNSKEYKILEKVVNKLKESGKQSNTRLANVVAHDTHQGVKELIATYGSESKGRESFLRELARKTGIVGIEAAIKRIYGRIRDMISGRTITEIENSKDIDMVQVTQAIENVMLQAEANKKELSKEAVSAWDSKLDDFKGCK